MLTNEVINPDTLGHKKLIKTKNIKTGAECDTMRYDGISTKTVILKPAKPFSLFNITPFPKVFFTKNEILQKNKE
jgi:hypothetical protein